jgi:hypothetical protein
MIRVPEEMPQGQHTRILDDPLDRGVVIAAVPTSESCRPISAVGALVRSGKLN